MLVCHDQDAAGACGRRFDSGMYRCQLDPSPGRPKPRFDREITAQGEKSLNTGGGQDKEEVFEAAFGKIGIDSAGDGE